MLSEFHQCKFLLVIIHLASELVGGILASVLTFIVVGRISKAKRFFNVTSLACYYYHHGGILFLKNIAIVNSGECFNDATSKKTSLISVVAEMDVAASYRASLKANPFLKLFCFII